MPLNLESLPDAAKTAFLARIAHTLTICARETYEVGTENVLEPQTLRAFNELLHVVTGSVVGHLAESPGYSFQSTIEMVRSFGSNHGRTGEVNWALEHALQMTEKELMK
jgi:hypothetical protein